MDHSGQRLVWSAGILALRRIYQSDFSRSLWEQLPNWFGSIAFDYSFSAEWTLFDELQMLFGNSPINYWSYFHGISYRSKLNFVTSSCAGIMFWMTMMITEVMLYVNETQLNGAWLRAHWETGSPVNLSERSSVREDRNIQAASLIDIWVLVRSKERFYSRKVFTKTKSNLWKGDSQVFQA